MDNFGTTTARESLEDSQAPPAKRQRLNSTSEVSSTDNMNTQAPAAVEQTMESNEPADNTSALPMRPMQTEESPAVPLTEGTSSTEQTSEAREPTDTSRETANDVNDQPIQDDEQSPAEQDNTLGTQQEQIENDEIVATQQEVNDAAAAADRATAADMIDQQTRFLLQFSRENPQEFARWVADGIVDQDTLDHIQQVNAQAAAGAAAIQINDGEADTEDGPGGNDNTVIDGTEDVEGANDGDGDDDGVVATSEDQADNNASADNVNNPADGAQAAATTAGGNTDHFIWLSNRNDARDENDTCPACTVEFDPNEPLVFLNCGHKWCADCLNSNYRAALRNRKDFPPRCCDIPLDHESVQQFLDEDILFDLVTKMDEYADPDPVYCQTPKCSGGYISKNRIDGQWASCQVCRLSTCVECKGPASEHPMPKMHPKMLAKLDDELATKEGWKICPGCKNLVERIDGCNFMTCDCGHNFCYKCGGTLVNNMPCQCQPTPAWVQEMNDEAAGSDDEDDEDDEDDREDDEEDEGSDDEGEDGENPNEGADGVQIERGAQPAGGNNQDTDEW